MKEIIESFLEQGFAIIHDVLEDLCVEDLKHESESYHYTAWIKHDIRSIIEIDQNILDE